MSVLACWAHPICQRPCDAVRKTLLLFSYEGEASNQQCEALVFYIFQCTKIQIRKLPYSFWEMLIEFPLIIGRSSVTDNDTLITIVTQHLPNVDRLALLVPTPR